jgi:hypothetical protein
VRVPASSMIAEAGLQAPIYSPASVPPTEPSRNNVDGFPEIRQGYYRVRLASSDADRMAAFHLRFLVFNLELGEGLEAAYATGRDMDQFDAVCEHLIVEHTSTGKIVGTYRLQTGAMASANAGFYSEGEFDFAPYRHLQGSLIELGRACVNREHRSTEVLYPAVARNRPIRETSGRAISHRLLFAHLAGPGTGCRRLSSPAEISS